MKTFHNMHAHTYTKGHRHARARARTHTKTHARTHKHTRACTQKVLGVTDWMAAITAHAPPEAPADPATPPAGGKKGNRREKGARGRKVVVPAQSALLPEEFWRVSGCYYIVIE